MPEFDDLGGFDGYSVAKEQGEKGMQDLAALHYAHFAELVRLGMDEELAADVTSAYVVASTRPYGKD